MTTWIDILLRDGYTFTVEPDKKFRCTVTVYDKDNDHVFEVRTNTWMTALITFAKSLYPEGTPVHWT